MGMRAGGGWSWEEVGSLFSFCLVEGVLELLHFPNAFMLYALWRFEPSCLVSCSSSLKVHLVQHRPSATQPPRLSTRELVSAARDIAAGMAHVAALGIVHRDLAARNCLIGFDGTVKVADFGMARFVDVRGKSGVSFGSLVRLAFFV
jgi:hypothetical protein